MKPFTKENRERPSYMRPLPEDPRKNRPKHSEAAPPKRPPPVPPPKTPPKGPMPPPPKKKAMPTAPKTPPKKPAEKPKTPAKERARLQRVKLQRHQYLFQSQLGLNLPRPLQRWLQRLRVKPFDQLAQLWSTPLQLRQSRNRVELTEQRIRRPRSTLRDCQSRLLRSV